MAVEDPEERQALRRVAQRQIGHVRVLHPHPPPLHRRRPEARPALLGPCVLCVEDKTEHLRGQ